MHEYYWNCLPLIIMKKIGVKYLKNVEDELDENIGEKQWTADMYYDKYII